MKIKKRTEMTKHIFNKINFVLPPSKENSSFLSTTKKLLILNDILFERLVLVIVYRKKHL